MRISDWSSDVCSSDLLGGATDGGDFEQEYNIVGGKRWGNGGLIATFDYRHSTPISAGQRSYAQSNHPSETLLNGQEQYSAVIAGHQQRSEERSVGKECVSTCRTRRSQQN